jgi:hypothetical protein
MSGMMVALQARYRHDKVQDAQGSSPELPQAGDEPLARRASSGDEPLA